LSPCCHLKYCTVGVNFLKFQRQNQELHANSTNVEIASCMSTGTGISHLCNEKKGVKQSRWTVLLGKLIYLTVKKSYRHDRSVDCGNTKSSSLNEKSANALRGKIRKPASMRNVASLVHCFSLDCPFNIVWYRPEL
jgi:hypothetical protein